MQIPPSLPPSLHVGDLLAIRGHRWRLLDVCAYERCQLLTVGGIGPANAGVERRFLMPFESVTPLDRGRSLRFVRPRRWRRACRALLADCAPPGALRAARHARIDLLPHQLEPALAVLHGRGSRVLLADDVGLGKTIQAGLIIAELQARGLADRVLIATPAGLRDQWRAELSDRFGIAAPLVDFREIRRCAPHLPVGLNPWTAAPMAITSIDYLKRPEVLQSVRSCRWDVMVVDEAHGAVGTSGRHAAVSALAARAAYVLLLTATPHAGDRRAFSSLCGIGALDDPLLVFRRTRRDVNLGSGRRVHRLLVRTSAAEVRMHSLLVDFTRAVCSEHDSDAAWLGLSVLHKRAFSSARSLELTAERRLAALGPDVGGGFHQLALPIADGLGELDEADEPPDCLSPLGLGDRRHERSMLRALRDAAREAAAGETKISVIQRLLRRTTEPIVVFTEFRDTLLHLHAALGQPAGLLHGGMTRGERGAALDDFTTGRSRVLLATDAAGEGLNLHHRCRLVVNLELPWNPMRLEQRIGRVDRIGQRRTVHAIHLVARDTGETRVLDRLKARIARAQDDIAAANPIEDDEREVARAVIDRDRQDAGSVEAGVDADAQPPDTERLTVDLRDEARAESARLACARALADDADAAALAALEATGPWLARTRLRKSRIRLRHRAIAILRLDYEDAAGRLVDRLLVPLSLSLSHERVHPGRMKALVQHIVADLQARAEEASHSHRAAVSDLRHALVSVRLSREREVARAIMETPPSALQAGLFDRRAERTHLAELSESVDTYEELAQRLQIIGRRGTITSIVPRLLLVLLA